MESKICNNSIIYCLIHIILCQISVLSSHQLPSRWLMWSPGWLCWKQSTCWMDVKRDRASATIFRCPATCYMSKWTSRATWRLQMFLATAPIFGHWILWNLSTFTAAMLSQCTMMQRPAIWSPQKWIATYRFKSSKNEIFSFLNSLVK